MSRKALILSAMFVAGTAMASSMASAADLYYDWTFTSAPNTTDGNGVTFTASGQLEVDTSLQVTNIVQPAPAGSVAYQVISITGTDSYGKITGPNPAGNGSYIYDNVVFPTGTVPNSSTPAYLDWGGLLYTSTAANGSSQVVNLFSSVVTGGNGVDRYATAAAYDNNHAGTFALSAVPVPGALPLFGSALVGLGAFARRRRANKTA